MTDQCLLGARSWVGADCTGHKESSEMMEMVSVLLGTVATLVYPFVISIYI